MATNPTGVNRSYGFLEARGTDNVLGHTLDLRLGVEVGSAAAFVPTSGRQLSAGTQLLQGATPNLRVEVSTRTSAAVAQSEALGIGAWLFRDDADGGGQGTGSVAWIAFVNNDAFSFPAGAAFVAERSLDVAMPAGALAQPGSYKLAVVVFQLEGEFAGANGGPSILSVTDGAAPNFHDEFYIDADGNIDFSGVAPDNPALDQFVDGRVAWVRVLADPQSLTTSVAPDQRYGRQPTITLDVTSAAGVNNPKVIRVGMVAPTTAGPTVAPSASTQKNVTPPASGAAVTSASYNVDSLLPVNATAHRIRAFVGPAGGQAQTLNVEQPDVVANNGNQTLGDANDKAWIAFADPAPATGLDRVADSMFAVENLTDVNIGHALSVNEGPGLSPTGSTVHADAARTVVNRLFTPADSTLTDHDHPFMRTYVRDAFLQPIVGVAFLCRVLDDDGTLESSVAQTSGADGVLAWDVDVPITAKAFSRFKRTTPDDPDALGGFDVAIPLADVNRPAGSKTGSYPDPKAPLVTRSYTPATYPARSKRIEVRGNAFAGVNEPSAGANDEFGVTAEVIFAGMWSGNLDARDDNADGVPVGVVTRSKPTAGGSFAFKTADVIDEAAFGVGDVTRQNPTDVAGRAFTFGALTMLGRRAVFNRTIGSTFDVGTDLTAQEALDAPKGYSFHATETQTYDLLAAPSDATTYAYYQGFSRQASVRSSFGIPAGSVETPGFTTLQGVYGYRLQVVDFTIIRDDLIILLALNRSEVYPGATITFTASAKQVLPDNTRIGSTFDAAPVLYIDKVDAFGQPLAPVAQLTMTPVPGSDDYEAQFTPPDADHAAGGRGFSASCIGKVSGSRPAPGRALFMTGRKNPFYGSAGAGNSTIVARHLKVGDSMGVVLWIVDDASNQLVALSSPRLIVQRVTGGRIQYLNAAATAFVDLVGAAVADEHAMTETQPGTSRLYSKVFPTSSPLWTERDVQVILFAEVGNVTYQHNITVEVVGQANPHSGYGLDAVGLALSGRLSQR